MDIYSRNIRGRQLNPPEDTDTGVATIQERMALPIPGTGTSQSQPRSNPSSGTSEERPWSRSDLSTGTSQSRSDDVTLEKEPGKPADGEEPEERTQESPKDASAASDKESNSENIKPVSILRKLFLSNKLSFGLSGQISIEIDVEFLRVQVVKSGVCGWQHTLVG